MATGNHNYARENKWEDSPKQVKRRESRNRVRAAAVKKYGKAKLKGKELDHEGYHLNGTLANVPARIVSRKYNRERQPPHKAKKS